MPRNLLLNRIGFTQGIKRSADPSVVPETALWDARNVRADQSGVLRIRGGTDGFTESLGTGPVQGAGSAFGDMLKAWGRNLYRVDSQGAVTVLGTGIIGATTTDPVEMVRWARGGSEIVYLLAGNGIYETDGSTVSLVAPYEPEAGKSANLLRAGDGSQDLDSGPAKSRLSVLRASLSQRLAVAVDNTVYLSAPLDASYFPADQVIQLPDDGGVIIALVNWYGALVIFRDRDIWAFFGTDLTDASAALVLQVAGVGCVASRSAAYVPGFGIVFLGADNVYRLTNVEAVENMATVEPVGDDIRHYLVAALAQGYGESACAVYHNREYWLCLPQAAVPVYRLSLQYATGWYVDSEPRAAQFIVYGGSLYAAGWEMGGLYKVSNTLTDQGKPIRFYVAFRREPMLPGPSRLKKAYVYTLATGRRGSEERLSFGPVFGAAVYGARNIIIADVVLGSEQHLDVTLVVDGREFTARTYPLAAGRSAALGFEDMEPVQAFEAAFHPSLQGYFAQVRVSSAPEVAGEDIALLGYGLEYEPAKAMQGKKV